MRGHDKLIQSIRFAVAGQMTNKWIWYLLLSHQCVTPIKAPIICSGPSGERIGGSAPAEKSTIFVKTQCKLQWLRSKKSFPFWGSIQFVSHLKKIREYGIPEPETVRWPLDFWSLVACGSSMKSWSYDWLIWALSQWAWQAYTNLIDADT